MTTLEKIVSKILQTSVWHLMKNQVAAAARVNDRKKPWDGYQDLHKENV